MWVWRLPLFPQVFLLIVQRSEAVAASQLFFCWVSTRFGSLRLIVEGLMSPEATCMSCATLQAFVLQSRLLQDILTGVTADCRLWCWKWQTRLFANVNLVLHLLHVCVCVCFSSYAILNPPNMSPPFLAVSESHLSAPSVPPFSKMHCEAFSTLLCFTEIWHLACWWFQHQQK